MANRVGISGMHHVSLRVEDMEQSLAFYRDVLGLGVKAAFMLDGLQFVMLDTGQGYLELVEMKKTLRPVGEEEVMSHFAFRTHDLEKSLDSAEKAGCEVTVPIRQLSLVNEVDGKSFSLRVAFFRGPDGELVELLEDKSGLT